VKNAHISDCDTLTNKMEVKLNMLGVLVLDGVGGEIDRANIVAVD
jgi:hypothetical protein